MERIRRVLDTDVEHALRLAVEVASGDPELCRYAASLLAFAHPAEELAAASFAADGVPEELRACLVQEMVLRDAPVAELPGVVAWVAASRRRGHPLAWLPLSRYDVEEEPTLPRYYREGSSCSMPYGSYGGPAVPADPGAKVPAFGETTTEPVARAMGAAVANWVEESNGRVEARVFGLAEPLAAGAVPGMLAALGMECLRGAEPASQGTPTVTGCEPAHAWQALFAAASTGGAYSHGCHGAYGRLAAWRSLAALTGAREGATADEVAARVGECTWYGLSARTGWFADVAWDIGLVTVDPERRRLAVLAATDTD